MYRYVMKFDKYHDNNSNVNTIRTQNNIADKVNVM
jgi:hypothetical protein